MFKNAQPATRSKLAAPSWGRSQFLPSASNQPPAALERSTPGIPPERPDAVASEVSPATAATGAPTERRRGRWWTAQQRRTPPATGAAAAAQQTTRPVKGAARRVATVQPSLLVPRPDVFPSPAALRGTHAGRIGNPFLTDSWFLLGAHGGAGASVLARLSATAFEQEPEPGPEQDRGGVGVDAGQLWPDPTLERTGAVVVVSRTTVSGLTKARDLAAQYLAGGAPPGTALLGVVLVADQPGKLPTPIATSVGLLDGVFARTWHVPYVPQYRLLGPTSTPPVHPLIADVLTDIRAALSFPSAFPSTEGPSQ